MTFDLRKLQARQAQAHSPLTNAEFLAALPPHQKPELEDQLRASLDPPRGTCENVFGPAVVLINRPDAPPNPNHPKNAVVVSEVIDTTGEEAPAPPPFLPQPADAVAAPASCETSEDCPAVATAKRGRGRPRKAPAPSGQPGAVPAPAPAVAGLEDLASEIQVLRDAASVLVDALNARLRALGVRL